MRAWLACHGDGNIHCSRFSIAYIDVFGRLAQTIFSLTASLCFNGTLHVVVIEFQMNSGRHDDRATEQHSAHRPREKRTPFVPGKRSSTPRGTHNRGEALLLATCANGEALRGEALLLATCANGEALRAGRELKGSTRVSRAREH